MLKRRESLYFIEKPIERRGKDLIGISKQVEYLKETIKNGARFIGVISGFSSGKSSITNKIKLLGYKVIKINMWKEMDVKAETTEELHKDFLYQLAMRTKKIKTQYLLDRYSNSGKKMKITSKTEKLSEFLILTVVFGILSWLINTNIGMTFMVKLISAFGFNLISSVNLYTFILSCLVLVFLIYLVSTIYCLIKNGFVLSFWGTESQEFSKNEMMEIYNSIIGKNQKYIIIIEDIDRTNNQKVRTKFIRELYEMYYKSNDKSVFIIEIGKEQLKEDKENDIEKQFDVMLECGEIDFTNADVKMLESLLLTKKQELLKIGLDVEDKNIKWDLLCMGDDITLRKLKHRYNKAILKYETLRSRFPNSKILINTCLAIEYLLDKYKTTNDEGLKKIIKKYLALSERNQELSPNDGLEKEIYSFVKDGTLTEEYNRYTNNYPMASNYRTEDEFVVYQLVFNNDIENARKEAAVINRLKTLKYTVTEALERRMNIHSEIPEVMLENKRLFNSVVSNKKWQNQFIEQFAKVSDMKKIIYISKLVEYNLSEQFWKELLAGKELNTYKFRSELYQYEACIINIELLKELYKNDEDPIRAEEIKNISNVRAILTLIDMLKDKGLKIKKINEIFEHIEITQREAAEIELYIDDLLLNAKIEDKNDLAVLCINIIENKIIMRSKQLAWLLTNVDEFNEETIRRITEMLNNKLNFGEQGVEELVLLLVKRNKKYGLKDLYTSRLLVQGYYYEYLICKALYEGILNDTSEIKKEVYVKIFKEYYDGENLNIHEKALIKMYDEQVIASEPWHKIKVFVGIINSVELYKRMIDLVAEGNDQIIELFDLFESLSEQEDYEFVSYVCNKIHNSETRAKLKDKIYYKVRGRSKTKLTNSLK